MGWHDGQRAINAIAAEQWGLVTTRQAFGAGVNRMHLSRLAAAGLAERLSQGVYRVAGAPQPEHQEILVAWLALHEFGQPRTSLVVGGVAAAQLHGIGQFWMREIDLLAPTRRRSGRDGVRIRATRLGEREVVTVHGVPTLAPSHTISDLLVLGESPDTVADAAVDALELGITTTAAIREALLDQPVADAAREMFTDALEQRIATDQTSLRSPRD
ncbi:type IV toxin-antitoxin system AbiEi family antitoxin domain-containing protein [Agrococcus sp. KRD186]|uniref:type IV toxin-antitoxin system AbiEi family antitoxin domain-containing protein n=1 Tax=Agrococcus sp. KRD186 TaxID=2729730 RepID=UPI0019D0045C|nr:type IV toxin-antitoxin system AbiEi family antitoxin domain-containing protein [Agrococcus sp. KRD186]